MASIHPAAFLFFYHSILSVSINALHFQQAGA
ncbi:uncharacterized protein METZ01_LOCUS157865, partial [marine metagenome]